VVSDRDFCNARIVRKDFPKKGDVICMVKSIKYEKCPENKGIVRAWVHFTYFCLTALPDGTTQVFFAAFTEIGGSIPNFVINQLGGKMIPTLFDVLLKYCQEQEGKISPEILDKILPYDG
jgi:START domain